MDRLLVRCVVMLRIEFGQRRFAQHVVRVAVAARFVVAAVFQRLVDGLAGDELVAQHAHRHVDALADQRFAALGDHARERRAQALLAIGRDQLAGDEQAPGGRVDEQRRRLAQVLAPVALADLVGDQAVGRFAVRNAQQCFGQAHQCHAFFGRQREFVHQGVHARRAGAFFTHGSNQAVRQGLGIMAGAGTLGQQPLHCLGFIAAVGGRDGGAQGSLVAFDFSVKGVERNEGGGRVSSNLHGYLVKRKIHNEGHRTAKAPCCS